MLNKYVLFTTYISSVLVERLFYFLKSPEMDQLCKETQINRWLNISPPLAHIRPIHFSNKKRIFVYPFKLIFKELSDVTLQ